MITFKHAKNNQGFTLLETMIAMAIMLIAFASILVVQSSSINTSAKAKQMIVVGMLAKNKMVETEFLIEGKAFEEIRTEESGQFKDPFQDYTWKRTISEITFPSLNFGGDGQKTGDSNSESNGSSGGGNTSGGMAGQITKLFTQYLSKAMREVTITISWKRGKGEQKFSLSTYWVDLDHEFQLNEQ